MDPADTALRRRFIAERKSCKAVCNWILLTGVVVIAPAVRLGLATLISSYTRIVLWNIDEHHRSARQDSIDRCFVRR